MRIVGGLIMMVYIAGIANEWSIDQGKLNRLSTSELVKGLAQSTICSLEWPVNTLGRVIVGGNGP